MIDPPVVKTACSYFSDLLKTDEAVEAFEYYEGNTLTIEIIKDDVLQKLYFRVKDKVWQNSYMYIGVYFITFPYKAIFDIYSDRN